MGKITPTSDELARAILSGAITSSTQSGWFAVDALNAAGFFNFALWGTFSATVALEKSYDGGTTAIPVALDSAADAATYTAPGTVPIKECERGVLYRVNVTYSSGTVNYRFSY